MIGPIASGSGNHNLLLSDAAVGGLLGGGPAGHHPLLDPPRHSKQPALPALFTAPLKDPPVLLLPQLVRLARLLITSSLSTMVCHTSSHSQSAQIYNIVL